MLGVWFFAYFGGFLFLQGVYCEFDQTQFTHNLYLDADENYKLFWRYYEDDGTIAFGAQVKTAGYIGLGFSQNGGMENADIFTGWVSNTGEVYGQDRYSIAESLPSMDSSQDFEIISGEESGETTSIVFQRSVKANCDSNDRSITVGATRLIWSFGQNDPESNDENSLVYHGTNNRGTKTVYLLDKARENIELPEETQTFDLLNDNLLIPDEADTTYWCHAFKLPDFGGEKHLIKFEPVIQEGNELLVHHILVYECYDPSINDTHDGLNHKCYEPELGPLLTCNKVMLAWAIGGEDFYFPENVGYPLGTDDSPQYVVMEVHYDNPDYAQRPANRDSSGIRIHYTSQLREHRAGIFLFGSVVNVAEVIPPGSKGFTVSGICPNECLDEGFNDDLEEVTVFAGLLHSHLAGEALRARHFRNGEELEPILVDETYDFNLQELRPLNDVKVRKGDSVIIECKYNTEGRDTVTLGGLGTKEEMCLSFMYYYPKIEVRTCESLPLLGDILEAVTGETGFELFEYYGYNVVWQPESYQNQTYKGIMADIEWTDELTNKLENIYLKKSFFTFCDIGKDYLVTPHEPFEILAEWIEEETTCEAPPLREAGQWALFILTLNLFGFLYLT